MTRFCREGSETSTAWCGYAHPGTAASRLLDWIRDVHSCELVVHGCIFKTKFVICILKLVTIFKHIYVLVSKIEYIEDFEDCRMLAKLFKKMLKTDAEGHERLGLDEFRKLVETHDFRSYLQTRGECDSWTWLTVVGGAGDGSSSGGK